MFPGIPRQLLFISCGYLSLLIVTAVSPSNPPYSAHCKLWNAALCKNSSMVDAFVNSSPERAVDGNRNQNYAFRSCIHTNERKRNNWWMVDLLEEYLVHQIILTNRNGIESRRLASGRIDLFLSNPKDNQTFPSNEGMLCGHWNSPFEGTAEFDCPSPTYARYVKLLQTNSEYLNFCELEVMVSKKRGGPDCEMTLSKPFTVIRNSTLVNGVVLKTISTNQLLSCLSLCAEKSYIYNACYWTQETRECQMLKVDPYNYGRVVNTAGTDFCVEIPQQC